MHMERRVFSLVLVAALVLLAAGPIQASPFQYTDNVLDGVTLSAGRYDATLDLNGEVWQAKHKGGKGWEPDDQITVTALLDGSVVGSSTVTGLEGQNVPFHLPLTFSVDAKDESLLQFDVSKRTSEGREMFQVNSAVLSGDFQATSPPVLPVPTIDSGSANGSGSGPVVGGAQGGGDVHSVPEGSSWVLVATGLALLASGRTYLKR